MRRGAHAMLRNLPLCEGGDICFSIDGVEIATDVVLLCNNIMAIFSRVPAG